MASDNSLKAAHLRPGDWIRAGMGRLAIDGVESVRVELLARELRVSKGSFYWHFHDREELLARILNHWEGEEEERLNSYQNQSAAQRWAWFVEQNSAEDRARIELGIRAWARKDTAVAGVVARLDQKRQCVIAAVLGEIGFDKSSAQLWAEVTLLVCLGWLDRAANKASLEAKHSGLNELLSRIVLAASGQPSGVIA
jgi:AcrR family transcriptional regulator